MAVQRLSARPMPTATRLPKAQSQAFVSPNAPILLSLFRILHIFYSIKAAFSLFFVYFCKKGLEKVITAKRRQYALANNAEKHHR